MYEWNKKIDRIIDTIPKSVIKEIYSPKRIVLLFITVFYLFTLYRVPLSPIIKNLSLRADFLAFYLGGRIVEHDSMNNLYDLSIQKREYERASGVVAEGFLTFKNTPLVALFHTIFSHYNVTDAYILNYYFQLTILLVLVILISLVCRITFQEFFFVIISFSFLIGLIFGQISLYFLALFFVTFLLIRDNRDFLAGLCMGFLFNKIQYVIFIPFITLSAKNRKQFIFGSAISTLFNVLLNMYLYGKYFLTDYFSFLLITEGKIGGTDITGNVSLISPGGIFQGTSVFLPTFLPILLLCVLIYIILFMTFLSKRKNLCLEESFALSLVIPMCLNVHAMPPDHILLILPVVLLFSLTGKKHTYYALTLLILPWLSFIFLQPLIALILLIESFSVLIGEELPFINRVFSKNNIIQRLI